MKKYMIAFALMTLCIPFAFSTSNSNYYSDSYARLSYVKGDVYIQRSGDLGYEEGVVNLPVIQGDKLGTGEGRAEISLGHGNYLRIDHNTQIDFAGLPVQGNDIISIQLLEGGAYLRISSLRVEKGVEIHTPDGSFYVLSEGLYRLDVSVEKNTELTVLEGEMEAAGEEGSIAVERGESLLAENGYLKRMNGLSSSYTENFSEWNRTRDSFLNRRVYRNYLPNELNDYESELAYYGRWTYESSFGYVWVPNVYSTSWRPYYNGRWSWYPVIGWTWVSYEPWGWCVSHYGRWHWRLGLGWYWIPTRNWGPAWVSWYSGYDYIGWAPLSYWNRPVAIVNNRFYGRYNSAYPFNSRALTVVRKNQLQARRISKVALNRNSRARLGSISLSSRQPHIKNVMRTNQVVKTRAARVLNRSSARSVNKSFVSSRALSSTVSRSRTSGAGAVRSLSRRRTAAVSRSSTARRSGVRTYGRSSNLRTSTSNRSSSKITRSRTSGTVSRSSSRRLSSRSRVKKYPSSQVRSSRMSSSRTKTSSTGRAIKRYGSSSRPGTEKKLTRSSNSSINKYRSNPARFRSPGSSSFSSRRTTGSSSSRSSIRSYSSRLSSRNPSMKSRSAPSSRSAGSSRARISRSSVGRSSYYKSPSGSSYIRSRSSSRSTVRKSSGPRTYSPRPSSRSSSVRSRSASSSRSRISRASAGRSSSRSSRSRTSSRSRKKK